MRREMIGRVQEIGKVLRDTKGMLEFDEDLFGMLVERIMVINLVRVEFVLRSGISVMEIL